MGNQDKQDTAAQIAGQRNNIQTGYTDYINNGIKPVTDTALGNAADTFDSTKTSAQNLIDTGGVSQSDIDKLNGIYAGQGLGGSDSSLKSATASTYTPQQIQAVLAGQGGGSGGGGGGFSVGGPNLSASAFKDLSSNYSGVAAPDYSASDAGYKDFAATGGVDQSVLNQGNQGLAGLASSTGGLSADDISSVSRPMMQQIEQTGGYTPTDLARLRGQAASSAPAYFQQIKDQIDQGRAITGNLAGAGTTNFALARQAAQQKNADINTSEIGIKNAQIANQMAASGQLSQANQGILGLRSSNQLTANQDINQQNDAAQQMIQQGKLAGLGGLAADQTNTSQFGLAKAGGLDQFSLGKAGGLDSYTIAQAQLAQAAAAANASLGQQLSEFNASQGQGANEFNANATNSAGQFNAGNLTGISQFNTGQSNTDRTNQANTLSGLIGTKQQGIETGTSDMSGLFNTNINAGLQGLGMQGNAMGNMYGMENSLINTGLSNDQVNQPWYSSIMPNIIGALGGIATGGLTGGSNKNNQSVNV